MSKKSQIDLAIEKMEGEIAVLQAAIVRLRQQQADTKAKRQKAVDA